MIFFLFLELSQDTIPSDTIDVVFYEAKYITYDIEKSLVILTDSSFITYGNIKLFSDSAYYYIDKNQLEAFGKCDLQQMDDSIKGDYFRYNIGTKKALMNNGKTQIEKGFIDGKKIYLINENTVNAYSGKYTTCSDSHPHYYFYAPKMKVYLGDMVIARPVYLYIQDVPVAAAPFWFVPISSKRKSGLIPFRAGNSHIFGKYIRGFAYYVVISDYADMTLQLDAMEKKGMMPQLEGVWNFSPFSNGTIFVSYIKEIDTKRVRYSIEGRNNSPYFLLGSNFNCDVKYLSDNTYHQAYAETTTLWLEREITSQATLNRDLGEIKNSIAFERKVDFLDTTTYEKLPNYTIATPSKLLFSLITYSFAGHISRDRQIGPHAQSEVSGANIHTAPTLQQNVRSIFTVSPRLDLDLAVYDKDTTGAKLPTRFGYSFGTNMNTNLYRIFDIEFFGIHSMLHKVIPNISYIYTPDFNFGRFPSVAGIPGYGHSHSIGFSVSQEFEAKVGEKKEKKNLLRLDLTSGYNLLTDTLSPIIFFTNTPFNPFPKPVTNLSSRIDGSINPYTWDYIYTISNQMTLKNDFLTFNLNQSYTMGGIYQFWFNGDIKPTQKWTISYAARYDWQSKRLVDYSLTLSRDLHCWEGVFSFSQLGNDWRYDFKVRIKEIPEVTIGRGLFGYVLE